MREVSESGEWLELNQRLFSVDTALAADSVFW